MYNDFSVCPNSRFKAYLRHYYFWVGYYYVLCVIMDMSTLQSLLQKLSWQCFGARTVRVAVGGVAVRGGAGVVVCVNKKLKFIISAVE